MTRILNLDMDGVLADFDAKFYQLLGRKTTDFDDQKEFWRLIGKHQDLFKNLDPMPDAHELVFNVRRLAKIVGAEIEILTAVPMLTSFPDAAEHKREWIEKHFPFGWKFKTGPYSRDKQNHAKKGDVLIDDRERNINQWNDAGGHGILHTSAENSLRDLKHYLSVSNATW